MTYYPYYPHEDFDRNFKMIIRVISEDKYKEITKKSASNRYWINEDEEIDIPEFLTADDLLPSQ